MKRRIKQWGPLLVVTVCVLAYFGICLFGMHTDAYRYLARAIRSSPEIRRRIGDVRAVHLSLLGGFTERFVGSRQEATMTLIAVGTGGELRVRARVEYINGDWSVSSAEIAGMPVALN